MTLPKNRILVMIDSVIDQYEKRHDKSEWSIEQQLCQEILLDLLDIKKAFQSDYLLITKETNGDGK